MTTKRNKNNPIEEMGIDYAKKIVKRNNCIFQEISLKNDQGNDCYIEFISNNVATSFCVFAQIKSGKSYRDKSGYKIPADQDHLTYWNNHAMPIVGLVYDEEKDKAFWTNISKYILENPKILSQKSHNIRIPKENEFNFKTFHFFMDYFMDYIQRYKGYNNFGKSLELFSEIQNAKLCYEGLKSLFSNHRDRPATWFYIISNFGKVKERGIHGNILGMLSNYADNPHIFWHEGNAKLYPTQEMKSYISHLVNQYFHQKEVEIAVSFMNEGVARGSFSFLVFMVLEFKKDVHKILKKMIQSEDDKEKRDHYFWLFIHFLHRQDLNQAIKEIDGFLKRNANNSDNCYLFEGMKETLIKEKYLPIG